jgi:hypothetical protein
VDILPGYSCSKNSRLKAMACESFRRGILEIAAFPKIVLNKMVSGPKSNLFFKCLFHRDVRGSNFTVRILEM